MGKKIKKLICIVLAGIIVVSCAACGKTDTGNAEESEQISAPAVVEEPAEAGEPEEVSEEQEEKAVTSGKTLVLSVNEYKESLDSALLSIDDNIKASISGLSSDMISGYFSLNKTEVIGLIYFVDESMNNVGGSGNNGNVIHQIKVTSMKKDSAGKLIQDKYQESVIAPASIMAADSSLSYEEAVEIYEYISSTWEGREVNGVTYLWISTFSDAPELKSLVISVEG